MKRAFIALFAELSVFSAAAQPQIDYSKLEITTTDLGRECKNPPTTR